MLKRNVSDSGWSATATEELIAAAQEHGRDAQDVVPTSEQVLAVAKPVVDQVDRAT
jgi:hypothetical protein